jgi:hypothetical protein
MRILDKEFSVLTSQNRAVKDFFSILKKKEIYLSSNLKT